MTRVPPNQLPRCREWKISDLLITKSKIQCSFRIASCPVMARPRTPFVVIDPTHTATDGCNKAPKLAGNFPARSTQPHRLGYLTPIHRLLEWVSLCHCEQILCSSFAAATITNQLCLFRFSFK